MTAVMTEARKNEEPTLEDLRTFADRAEKAVREHEASLANARCRRESLRAERGSLVHPARVQKDSKAQKRVYEIDEQVPALDRDIRDDETVLGDMKRRLSLAQQNLERAEWELKRSAVRKMVEARLSGNSVAAIEKAVKALATALQSAIDEDEAIRVAALNFTPHLVRDLRYLQMAGLDRSRLAAFKLQNALPIDMQAVGFGRALADRQFTDSDRQQYGEILKAIDRLELVF